MAVRARIKLIGAMIFSASLLGGCENVNLPNFSLGKKTSDEDGVAQRDDTVRLVERDVEAPDVFQVTENGLWDGRPSLGGVWVAYPGDIQPERVIIRNETNNKFVIGALFKRERVNPGPKIQISSDAAAALGILAGKPSMLNVTALRRESVPEATAGDESSDGADTSISEIATAAIDEVEETPKPTIKTAGSTLDKPYIQLGIFSVQANAENTATSMRTQGIVPLIKEHKLKGKTFWRVIVGPATSKNERGILLKKARDLGFADAYFVRS